MAAEIRIKRADMKISCKETVFTYNVYHLAKAFFPEAEIEQCLDAGQEPLVKLELDGGSCFCVFLSEVQEVVDVHTAIGMENMGRGVKQEVTRRVYAYLSEQTGRKLAWGMLTGVRPTKLATQLVEREKSEDRAVHILQNEYAVTPQKAKLAVEIARREKELLAPLDIHQGFSLYVGIPFCPSICSYCSFSSSPAALWQGKMDAYLDALCLELSAAAEQTRGKKLNTIYIGGGTPTTLEPERLERLLAWIDEQFGEHMGEGNLLEYTVEAGRPDSITKEKLEVIRRHPVSRISINPQTMQQRTLDAIGRQHTVEDVRDAFTMARAFGYDNINMDLIAGLPGEDARDMCDTLRQIEMLRPNSLTIHSLAIKRAARMGQEKRSPQSGTQAEIEAMVETGAMSASRMGLLPYYLYRQKNIAGNFENVGYAKVDKAGIYNILIMEEKQSIVACGAGSVSKRIDPDGGIRRCENVKDVSQYIERIDEMIERKKELFMEGYSESCQKSEYETMDLNFAEKGADWDKT